MFRIHQVFETGGAQICHLFGTLVLLCSCLLCRANAYACKRVRTYTGPSTHTRTYIHTHMAATCAQSARGAPPPHHPTYFSTAAPKTLKHLRYVCVCIYIYIYICRHTSHMIPPTCILFVGASALSPSPRHQARAPEWSAVQHV